MQGFLSILPIRGTEKFLYMRKRMKARINGIGTYKFILDTDYCLDLEKCLYVSVCAKNLISIAKLDKVGFNFKIDNESFSLYNNLYYYGSGTLIDDLYHFNFDIKFFESLFHVEHSNHVVYNENYAFLFHQRLGHISKETMSRLVKMIFCLNWIL